MARVWLSGVGVGVKGEYARPGIRARIGVGGELVEAVGPEVGVVPLW